MASSSKTPPSSRTARARPGPLVRQFSVFLENKCGRLLDFIRLFEQTNIHILGISVVDTTDSAVVRMVVDDPDKVDELFHISDRMMKIAMQSAVGGMLASIVGMFFAAAGILTPVMGAIIQEGIDLFAVLNALRVAIPPKDLTDFDKG